MIYLILILIIVATLVLWKRYPPGSGAATWLPQRAFTYILALAAILAVLAASTSLLGLLFGAFVGQIASGADIRSRASFSLAALIVGAPIGWALWAAAQRRASGSYEDRDAPERRLFLALLFFIPAAVALTGAVTVLQVLLTRPAPDYARLPALSGAEAAARLIVFGLGWLYFARVGWRERPPRTPDAVHDLALYALACWALTLVWLGLHDALYQLTSHLVGRIVYEPAWLAWTEIASSLIVGAVAWAAFLRYDLARNGRRSLRVLYLYLVLAVAATWALGATAGGIYETLRRAFGYSPSDGTWAFLPDYLPWVLASGLLWAIHWALLRRQAALVDASLAAIGGIPWPRRLPLAVLTLAGLSMIAFGAIAVIWVGFDALLGSAATRSGADWWRDQLSSGIAVGLTGLAAWTPSWLLLLHAASADPVVERTSLERRLLLFGVTIAGALAALGFAVALLWLILRTALGGAQDATTTANALQYLSAALLLGAVAGYHGMLLRADLQATPLRRLRLRVAAYVAPDAAGLLDDMRTLDILQIEVAGYLPGDLDEPVLDPPTLRERLRACATGGRADSVLLLLYGHGGRLYPYTRARHVSHSDALAASASGAGGSGQSPHGGDDDPLLVPAGPLPGYLG